MKTRLWFGRLAIVALSIGSWFSPLIARSESGTQGTNVVPLIVLSNVPVSDAIQNLARQADLNFILDASIPRGCGSVDGRWTDVTCRYALDQVLKQNDFELVENPATTIARIAPKSFKVQPVPFSAVGETNGASAVKTPLIVMDEVPLEVAITQLAANAKLKVSMDPRISNPVTEQGTPIQVPPVSIRWKDVTPRQALAALLDAYDLEMKEDAAGSVYRISVKKEDPSEGTANHANSAMELLEKIVLQLQRTGQTNTLKLFFDFENASIAERSYGELGKTLLILNLLREGDTNKAYGLLEQSMTGDVVSMATIRPQISPELKSRLNLKVINRVRDYCDKYHVKSSSPEVDQIVSNSFKMLDEEKTK